VAHALLAIAFDVLKRKNSAPITLIGSTEAEFGAR
jgi:hypothetical protein